MIHFRVEKVSQDQPHTLTLIVCMRFHKINFCSAAIDYENIFTTKISRFTVTFQDN